RGALSIDADVELRSLGLDLDHVPLQLRLRDRIYFGDVDNRARAVVAIGIAVEDVHLVATGRARLLRIFATDENAAVGPFIVPEFCAQLEVTVRILGHQEAVPPIGRDGSFGDA